MEKAYTTFQVARLCGVFPTTVIHWANRNKIKSYRTPGGHRRILASDLAAFAARYRMPIPEPRAARVMLVEDEPGVGLLLRRALERSDAAAHVEWLKNGVEALIALGREAPDLIILDVVMPLVDGARVLATLKTDPKTRHVKVIGITGKRLPPQKLKFMRRHTDAFFIKPFDIEQFVLTAEKLLRFVAQSHRR